MPEPVFLVRRSARMRPAKIFLETMYRYSSFLRKCSSNRSSFTRGRAAASATSGLRLGGLLEDLGDDRVGADALGLALEVEHDAVAQRRRRDLADVVHADREATVEEGADLGAEQDGLRAARRRAVADVLLDHGG